MPRARLIALGALVLLVALVPFVPHGDAHEATVRTVHDRTPAGPLVAGYGRVTPAYQRTIDQVVNAGAPAQLARTSSPRALVDAVVRCATFEGQRYCLGSGWTDQTQAQVRHRM